MNPHRIYALDANVFIEAHRRYYAFDLCPGFWDSLIWQQERGRIRSIDRVKAELVDGGDRLANWVKTILPKECFLSTDEEAVRNWFGQMLSWVQNQARFKPQAKAEFATKPDGWLIALAKSRNLVLVTHEELAKEVRKKVPIPNVCAAFDVPVVNTFEMLKELETKFSWQAPS